MNELLSQAKENLSFLGITAAVIIALAVISKLTEKKFTHLRHVSPARRVSIIGICSAIAVVLHILDFPGPGILQAGLLRGARAAGRLLPGTKRCRRH